jgi:hypothetical protein
MSGDDSHKSNEVTEYIRRKRKYIAQSNDLVYDESEEYNKNIDDGSERRKRARTCLERFRFRSHSGPECKLPAKLPAEVKQLEAFRFDVGVLIAPLISPQSDANLVQISLLNDSNANEPKLSFANEAKASFGNEAKVSFGNEPELSFGSEAKVSFGNSRNENKPPNSTLVNDCRLDCKGNMNSDNGSKKSSEQLVASDRLIAPSEHLVAPSERLMAHLDGMCLSIGDIRYDNYNSKSQKKKISHKVRRDLWELFFGPVAGCGECRVCGTPVAAKTWQAGHIVAEVHGGQMVYHNLVVSCGCNQETQNRHLFDFMGAHVVYRVSKLAQLVRWLFVHHVPKPFRNEAIAAFGEQVLIEFAQRVYHPPCLEDYQEWLILTKDDLATL